MNNVDTIVEFMEENSYSIGEACRALDINEDSLSLKDIELIEESLTMCNECLTYVHPDKIYSDGCEVCKSNPRLIQ